MKRWMPVVVGAVMILGTAGACDPPPPPGWVRPEVHDLAVAPSPVVPGESFTVSATLSDDHHVSWVEMGITSPTGLDVRNACVPPTFDPVGDPRTVFDLDVTCELPEYATNGTWGIILRVYDGEVSGEYGVNAGQASATFEVVGGSNDTSPPTVDALVIAPASPLQGQPFTVTVRASDDHFAPSAYGAVIYRDASLEPNYCESTWGSQVTPTQQEFVITCPGRSVVPAGHYTLHFYSADLNDNQLDHAVGFYNVSAEAG